MPPVHQLGLLTHLFIACLFYSGKIVATNYYISSVSGNDTFIGTNPNQPWQSLSQINATKFQPGDSVLFHSGETWRGQLIPQSGKFNAPVTYSFYGQGNLPQILGSVDVSDTSNWQKAGVNLWQSKQKTPIDIGNLIFNSENSCGFKEWDLTSLTQQGQFFWDQNGTQQVYLYSTANPGTSYQHIEAALGQFIIYCQADSFINLNHLQLKFGAADGIEVRNSHHIYVSDCQLSFIGGTQLNPKQRYGGGIQFWANSHDNTVERCQIHDIYDDAVTNQGNASAGGTVQQYNIYYQNNLIYNCAESSYCYYLQPATTQGSFLKNVYFQNNTCVNAGGGWAATQRPDLKGFQIYCSSNTAPLDSVFIRDNIFYRSRAVVFFDNTSINLLSGTQMDYNNWFTDNPQDTLAAFLTKNGLSIYPYGQFASYQSSTNQDVHSFFADPLLIQPTPPPTGLNLNNSDTLNLQLQPNSPCINAGISTQVTTDINFQPRPSKGPYDIGAYQHPADIQTAIAPVNNSFPKNLTPIILHEDQIQLFPNPIVSTNLTIQFAESINYPILLQLTDLSGKILWAGNLFPGQSQVSPGGNSSCILNLPNDIMSGSYLLVLQTTSSRVTKKLLVQR